MLTRTMFLTIGMEEVYTSLAVRQRSGTANFWKIVPGIRVVLSIAILPILKLSIPFSGRTMPTREELFTIITLAMFNCITAAFGGIQPSREELYKVLAV